MASGYLSKYVELYLVTVVLVRKFLAAHKQKKLSIALRVVLRRLTV